MTLSGGVTRVWRNAYPAPLNLYLATLLRIPQGEAGVPHDIEVKVIGDQGPLASGVKGGFQVGAGEEAEPGESLVVPVPIDLRGIALPFPGPFRVSVTIDGRLLSPEFSFVAKLVSDRPAIGS